MSNGRPTPSGTLGSSFAHMSSDSVPSFTPLASTRPTFRRPPLF